MSYTITSPTTTPGLLAYRTVPEHLVPAAKVALAKQAIALACDLLDAPKVSIAWFEHVSEEVASKARRAGDQSLFYRFDSKQLGGESDDRDPHEIRLDASLGDDRLVELIGHEGEHAAQALDGRVRRLMESQLEHEADAAGRKLLQLWKSTPPRPITVAAVERWSARPSESKQSWRPRNDVSFEFKHGRIAASVGAWTRWGHTEEEAEHAVLSAMENRA